VRAEDGRESLDPAHLDAALGAVRAVCGPLPLGVSTGAWIVPDPETRLATVARWRERPDFASVNFDETGATELAAALLGRNIGVEAGLSSAGGASAWVKSGLGSECLRALIEPQEADLSEALRTVDAIEGVVDEAGFDLPRLLHGADATAWPLLEVARTRGHGARIGLEDTLLLPDGRTARDNAELVAVALRILALRT
jgi:uncharacterized protein (DUF849 family)